MPELALALWFIYGAGALGLRVAIHLRRTGSTGLVGPRSELWSLPWLAETLHSVALGMGVAAPLLDLAGVVEPIGALDRRAVHIAGVTLFGVGLIGVIVGQGQMRDSWRIGTDPNERTDLVTGGLFALVRNPIYVALLPTLLGLALLVPNVVALSSVALFLAAVEIETRLIEEPHLLRAHGDAYARYAMRVGRFIPGIGRIRVEPEVPEYLREPAGRGAERTTE